MFYGNVFSYKSRHMHVHIVEISCSVLCFYNKISEVVCIIRERGLLGHKLVGHSKRA